MVENHRHEDHTYGFVGQWERFSGSTDERHPATSFPLRFRKHFLRWFYSDDVRVQSTRQPSRIATRSAAEVQYNFDWCVSERVYDDLQPPGELLRTITPPTIVAGGHICFVVIHSADCQITTLSRELQRNGPPLADEIDNRCPAQSDTSPQVRARRRGGDSYYLRPESPSNPLGLVGSNLSNLACTSIQHRGLLSSSNRHESALRIYSG